MKIFTYIQCQNEGLVSSVCLTGSGSNAQALPLQNKTLFARVTVNTDVFTLLLTMGVVHYILYK